MWVRKTRHALIGPATKCRVARGQSLARSSVPEQACRYFLDDRLALARLLASPRCFSSVGSA